MAEEDVANMVSMAEACGRRMQGRRRFGWMEGMKVAFDIKER